MVSEECKKCFSVVKLRMRIDDGGGLIVKEKDVMEVVVRRD
jgi:hypothetical protein